MSEEYSIFFPKSGRSLLDDYPELKKYPQLNQGRLRSNELLFVWYYACQASPYVKKNISDEKRVKFAYEKAFPTAGDDAQIKAKYMTLQFQEKISEAIEVMKRFNPGLRARGKFMIDKILENYEKLIDVDIDEGKEFNNKDGEVDWSKKKAYIDSCAKVAEVLPSLIEEAEGGFGVSSVTKLTEDVNESLIDNYEGKNK